jgi:hypothetical protein
MLSLAVSALPFGAGRAGTKKLQRLAETDWRDFQSFTIFGNSTSRNHHTLFSQHVRNLTVG